MWNLKLTRFIVGLHLVVHVRDMGHETRTGLKVGNDGDEDDQRMCDVSQKDFFE